MGILLNKKLMITVKEHILILRKEFYVKIYDYLILDFGSVVNLHHVL
jgi:hypothetical protein